MKSYHRKWMEKGLILKLSVLFLFGFLVGLLLFYGLAGYCFDINREEKSSYLKTIAAQRVDLDLFLYVTWQKMKMVLLFLCISMTWLWLPAICYVMIKQGVLLGYLAVTLVSTYKGKGILLLLGYYFPQIFLRIPLWLLCFYSAWELWRKNKDAFMAENEEESLHNKILLQINHKRVMIILALCIAESFLETFAGTFFLKKIILFLTGG